MNTPDVLDKAADIIEAQGYWCGDGPLPSDNGPQCVALAIYVATLPRLEGLRDATRAFGAFIGVNDDISVQTWSDAQGEAFPVINALRKCAEALR